MTLMSTTLRHDDTQNNNTQQRHSIMTFGITKLRHVDTQQYNTQAW
jgi:hypothetical protein